NNDVSSFSWLGENQPLENRRTTSSMAPTMVEDTSGLRLVLGTPGGDTIPSTLLQLVNSLVDYSVPIDLAVDAPRLHQGVARRAGVRMEGNRPASAKVRHGLAKLGHKFDQSTGAMGHANTIGVIDGNFYGYVDPREGGLALGPEQAH
ncbi:MAG: gamma-glutamyltransferase, partial [Myxococcales bacterium]